MARAATKERGILFSGEMVRAILDGRKTQTRRVVTKATSACASPWDRLVFDEAQVPKGAMPLFADDGYLHVPCRPHPDDPQTADYWTRDRVYCRFGPGDRLWVRETWQQTRPRKRDGQRFVLRTPTKGCGDLHYAADAESDEPPRWRPSIHMPRWASRITLEVTGIRIERLQRISDADVIAEGVEQIHIDKNRGFFHSRDVHGLAFGELWDSINAKRGYAWEDNPWVWVVEFRMVN